jgi:hypothetical protein
MPTFACSVAASVGAAGYPTLIKDDGNVWDRNSTDYHKNSTVIHNGRIYRDRDNAGSTQRITASATIDTITTDSSANFGDFNAFHASAGATTAPIMASDTTSMDVSANGTVAIGTGAGVLIGNLGYTDAVGTMGAQITRTVNSGILPVATVGAWLANSKTADVSPSGNTLTENGTVTEAAVESGAELLGYSGWSTSNYLSRANDSDYNALGTGSAYLSIWFKTTPNNSTQWLAGIGSTPDNERFAITMNNTGVIVGIDDGATATVGITTTAVFDDSVWHKADLVRISSTDRSLYIDGVLIGSSTTDAGSLTATVKFLIGLDPASSPIAPADESTISLVKLSATAPTATQVRQMYDAEKGMFVASAECLLQSGTTDAVIDVDVDPLSGKVLVTQTDAITIFDGLVVDSKPTVNSGASEKGKLWGALRAEQNSANAYVTAPAVDQRQVNEMVRGLASDLPAGVDLSKAKAWLHLDGTGTIAITSSYNIASVTDVGTGSYRVKLAVPFKSTTGFAAFGSIGITFAGTCQIASPIGHAAPQEFTVYTINHADSFTDNDDVYLAFFGELENE